MLSEIENARQIPGEGRRRWFRDEELDLIVWYDRGEAIAGFQLCYNKTVRERALTWRIKSGYSHDAIDEGDSPGGMSRTPILVADGVFEKDAVADSFRSRAEKLPDQISRLVLEKITAYEAR